jgi:PAS domain-containing protein
MPWRFKHVGLFWSIPYFFAACISALPNANVNDVAAASIWLPAGVAMAAMMLTRAERWVSVLFGMVAAQTLFGMLHGVDAIHALATAIGLVAAPAISLALVVRFAQVPLHGLYFLRALFFVALIESTLASVVDVTFRHAAVFTLSDVTRRGIAHFVGIFVVTPVFTTWSRFRPSRQIQHGAAEGMISGITFAALIPCAMLAFGGMPQIVLSDNVTIGLICLPLVLCVLISLLWDARGGALSVLTLAIVALWQTMEGYGPFSRTPDDASLIGVQMYLGVASVLVLLSTTLRGHRERALEHAHRWRTNIELALAGSGQLVYCLDTKSARIEWGGDVEAIAGNAPEKLATLEDVLGAIDAEDRVRARSRWLRAAGGQRVGDMTFVLRAGDGKLLRITDTSTAVGDLDEGAAFIAGTWRRAAASPGAPTQDEARGADVSGGERA